MVDQNILNQYKQMIIAGDELAQAQVQLLTAAIRMARRMGWEEPISLKDAWVVVEKCRILLEEAKCE